MADWNYRNYGAASIDSEPEVRDINQKIREILITPEHLKLVLSEPRRAQSLPRNTTIKAISCETNHESSKDLQCYNTSPTLFHYKYDYKLFHHGSPVNPKVFQHYLLPIGVFWDIENCPVPRGKSAAAVTQVIRDIFFNGYREAEFIVVCDVNKENKQVIQELSDAQVNLIHVAATYKNAADEKLKQSIRRFADIHGTPAAIILISSDINFAADLSDLRHRKRIHVILLHNENSSEALILCANEHYNFMELMEPLPIRTPAKASETYDLLVTNLPKDKNSAAIKRRLKQLSDNCGGRVLELNGSAAILRFGLQESADRAQKRMNGELVFDTKIQVKSLKEKNNRKTEENHLIDLTSETGVSTAAISSPVPMYSSNSGIAGVRSLPGTPHYHSSSPVLGAFSGWNGVHCPPHPGIMPPPIFISRPFSGNGDIMFNRPYPDMSRVPSPVVWPSSAVHQHNHCWEEPYKSDRSKNYGKRGQMNNRDGAINGSRTPEGMRRIRGTHGSSNTLQDWSSISHANYCPMSVPMNCGSTNFQQVNNLKRISPSSIYMQGRDCGQRGSHGQYAQGRSARTPSPFSNSSMQLGMPQATCTSPYQSRLVDDESEKFFNPINSRAANFNNSNNTNNNTSYVPVELQVTNLDQSIDPADMRLKLCSMFMEHVMVHHISTFVQSDGNYAACIKLACVSDAQYAISRLHRQKIGHKRILISYAHTPSPNPQLLKSHVIMLLQEVPGHKLPLFKFREMYESRFMISVSVSEIYKMKDVCIITEDPSGRMVSLSPEYRNTPSPCLENMSQDGNLELPYCIIHTQKPWSEKGWAEQEMETLPHIMMPLMVLGTRIQKLLNNHNGNLPLPTLPNCYEAEFQQTLVNDEQGVPLEHLISCLTFLDIKQGVGNVKYITWIKNKSDDNHDETAKCISPALVNQLTLFSREVVDLLKTASHCEIPFSRFIPAYHHHFGRQCRVADYGFTKLIDLLEALPQTIQVMGEGNRRMVTLSHRAQIRRFTSDLLRVLKAQASKQITLSDFPTVYTRVIAKPWNITDYGVCEIGDILADVSENTVVVTPLNGNDKLIAIPKRDQTSDEIERTKQFANEAVELLSHAPQCTMLFNKFVPSYHHHFGHQCRVSDYGFSKLIELFEAIPDFINIEEGIDGGDRRISLTEPKRFHVLGEHITKLIMKSRHGLLLSNIAQTFLRQYGYMLRPESYGCNSVEKLIEKLSDYVKVVNQSAGPTVILVEKSEFELLGLQCRRILMDQSQQRLKVQEFQRIYNQYYGNPCNMDEIRKLTAFVHFSGTNIDEIIELTPLQCFACNMYRVLMNNGGKMKFQHLENAYLNVIGIELKPSIYGFSSTLVLILAVPCTIVVRESRNKKKTLFLNKKLAAVGISVPSSLDSPHQDPSNDSINDSAGSESSFVSLSQLTKLHEWTNENFQKTWGNKDNYWSNSSKPIEASKKWPIINQSNEAFNSIMPHNSSTITESLPSDITRFESYSENEDDCDARKSSVWESPPKYNRNNIDYETSVDLPPLTLPSWSEHEDDHEGSSLLSPAKNLLSAAANPLNTVSSPYFCASRMVMAPHPSQLPLPSLSLAAKRSLFVTDTTTIEEKMLHTHLLGNSLEVHSPTYSESYHSTSEGEPSSDMIDTTPNKRLYTGKRKLAAQFDQSLHS